MPAAETDPIISRYSRLARAALRGEDISDGDGTCEEGCLGAASYTDRTQAPEAAYRASLGCGNPLMVADLRPGETVLDLGSGGGLDVLLSARRVAPHGVAYGLDASADMLALARANGERARITNARFLHGRIENIPLPDDHVDVIISNCVINLSRDKAAVLAEAFRVLKPGGRLGISDVTADENTEPARLALAEQQVGCLAGALTKAEYERLLAVAGFSDVTITSTSQAAEGLHSAIIHATKPAAGHVDQLLISAGVGGHGDLGEDPAGAGIDRRGAVGMHVSVDSDDDLGNVLQTGHAFISFARRGRNRFPVQVETAGL
jgi:ubiquinone/menaquinone biosynthesis C-methylase UbiE